MRIAWSICGLISLGLGIVGVVTPLVPTVPFILLAAFCFARSSESLHAWLLNHPRFGPMIDNWNTHGAISIRAKWVSTVSILAVFMISLALGLKTWVLAIQIVTLGCVAIFIWTRPDGSR